MKRHLLLSKLLQVLHLTNVASTGSGFPALCSAYALCILHRRAYGQALGHYISPLTTSLSLRANPPNVVMRQHSSLLPIYQQKYMSDRWQAVIKK